ncbi:MAG: AAC(3) family N-acetyltransferase [Chloroflexota bacterium]
MLTYRNLVCELRKLDMGHSQPVIAHTSLSAFGEIPGGAQTLVGALTSVYDSVIMPTFTYKTMLTPKVGPPNNGITYGSKQNANRMAEFFRPDMPADKSMGAVAETLRQHHQARRSIHPIYSFAGINADQAIEAQTLDEPLAPIRVLTEAGGWVLLLGANHTVNTSIHYAEKLSGRRQFIRWALTLQGVKECPGWPGCSGGFEQISPRLEESTRKVRIGPAEVRAIPLPDLVRAVREAIAENHLALLCKRKDCQRCNAIRRAVE